MKLYIILVLGAFCALASCRSTRNIQTAITKKDSVNVHVPVSVNNGHDDTLNYIKEVYRHLVNQRISYNTFSAKIDVDYKGGEEKKMNVTAHLRMQKDSVIWISITGILGFEGLRALITPDSVKLLDKQNKIYTARSVEFLQEMSELPIDLSTLQELIIGNLVFLDSNIVSYEKANSVISLLSIGTLFRNLLTIDEKSFKVLSSKLDDIDELSARTSYLRYDDYESKNGVDFPRKRSIHVTEKKNLEIDLNFKQYDFNETLSFPFSIPKNYERN